MLSVLTGSGPPGSHRRFGGHLLDVLSNGESIHSWRDGPSDRFNPVTATWRTASRSANKDGRPNPYDSKLARPGHKREEPAVPRRGRNRGAQMKKLALLLSFVSLALVSCGGGTGGTPTPPPPQTVSVSPSFALVPASATQQFTANQAVTWQVDNVTGGNSTVGTISTSGLYTAPTLPPASASVTIRAVSQADSSKSGSASVTVDFSNASINGRYAFVFTGRDSAGEFFIAGSFQADGSGNLTNGVEDLNHGTEVFPNLPFSGTYSVGPDGRGSAIATSSRGTSTFRLVLDGSGGGAIIAFDSTHGSGTLQKQDSSAFSSTAIAANWSFSFAGISSAGPAAVAGRFTLDAAGSVSAGAEDFNDSAAVRSNVPFTGTASGVSSNGRGTASFTSRLGTSQFALYVVSANKVVFVSLDFLPALHGSAEKQQSDSFSLSSLSGSYVFLLAGASSLGTVVDVGRFVSDGNGNLSSGVLDENDAGAVFQNQSFSGTYLLAANGRGTTTRTSAVGSASFAFYMVSTYRAFFVQTDVGGNVTTGSMLAQTDSPFSNSSLSGSYAFFMTGATTVGLTNIAGVLSSTGSGRLFDGIEDVNEGTTQTTGISFTGTYSVASNGRVQATITVAGTTSNFVFYITDNPTPFFIGIDPGEVLFGMASSSPTRGPGIGYWDY